jgi:hypothetical protein
MNENLNFWRIWTKNEKLPLFIGLFVLGLTTILLVYGWLSGLHNVIHWNVISEIKEKIINSNIFNDGTYSFSGSSPVWYIKERYLPSLISVNTLAYNLLLGFVLIGFIYYLMGTARLKSTWFLVGALVIAGLLVSLRLENAFLAKNSLPFLIAFTFIGGLYYLSNIYAINFNSTKTLLLWFLVFVILMGILIKFSKINEPIISVASYGLIMFMAISAIFIFIISHEILAGLIWLVSKNAKKGKSSLGQILAVGFIFFANLLLIYLENIKEIEKSVFIIHPILLYLTSLILGIWGFKKLVEQQNWFSFARSGVWLYLGMSIITTATLAFAYATANDALQELFEDYIAIAQLGVGICFFVWVLINYIQLFKQGLDVQKVLYKSPFSRLILSRVAAIFVVVFLMFSKNNYSFNQFNAGYTNAIADFYLAEGDLKAAETYYKSATNHDLYNHKANFSLASMALSQNDKVNAAFFFKYAIQKKASPYAYVGLSSSLENENMYFDAIFSLQEGIKKFPGESSLLTNMAYLQSKSNMVDSVLINLTTALEKCKKCDVEKTNLLSFWIENAKIDKLKEVTLNIKNDDEEYVSAKANNAAIDRIFGVYKPTKAIVLKKDSVLDVSSAAYIFNVLNNQKNEQKILDNKSIVKLQNNPGNDMFFEELSLAYATNNFYRENKLEGLKQMTLLANSDSKIKNIYNQNLGLWLLKEGVYNEALTRLNLAGDSSSTKILANPEYKEIYERNLDIIANQILKPGLTLENYKELINKAPLNPDLITKVADFLSSKKLDLEAYNLAFYASELNTESALLWKTYARKAMNLSQFDYAKDALIKLKPLVLAAEFAIIEKEYLTKINSNSTSKFE